MWPKRETALRLAAAAGTLAFIIAIYWRKRRKDDRARREAAAAIEKAERAKRKVEAAAVHDDSQSNAKVEATAEKDENQAMVEAEAAVEKGEDQANAEVEAELATEKNENQDNVESEGAIEKDDNSAKEEAEVAIEEVKVQNFEQTTETAQQVIAEVVDVKYEIAEDANGTAKEQAVSNNENETAAASSSQKMQSTVAVDPSQERAEVVITMNKEELSAFRKSGNVRRFQHETNARIIGRTLENGDRQYTISGIPENVRSAEQKIKRFLAFMPNGSYQIMVPERVLGRIIGKLGCNIKAIQEESGARIDIARSAPKTTESSYSEAGEVLRSIIIRGNQDQIASAHQLILDEIKLENTARDRAKRAAASRGPKPEMNLTKDKIPLKEVPVDNLKNEETSELDRQTLTLGPNESMEVYVTCVYHPNSFYVQAASNELNELEQMSDQLTSFYGDNPKQDDEEFCVGDLVGAYFDQDRKWHRAKVLKITDISIKVFYVDFGDKRTLAPKLVRKLHPRHHKLRFQATELSLNLGCPDGVWSDLAISEFVKLVGAGQWKVMFQANGIRYLNVKHQDVLWVELIGREGNSVSEVLARRGFGELPSDSESTSTEETKETREETKETREETKETREETNDNNENSSEKNTSASSSKTSSISGESSAGGRRRRIRSTGDRPAASTSSAASKLK